MSYIELFLLAAGLCFDTFAVSLTGGICTRGSLCVRQILRIIFCVCQADSADYFLFCSVPGRTYFCRLAFRLQRERLHFEGGPLGGIRPAGLHRGKDDNRGLLQDRGGSVRDLAAEYQAARAPFRGYQHRRRGSRHIPGHDQAVIPQDRHHHSHGAGLHGTGLPGSPKSSAASFSSPSERRFSSSTCPCKYVFRLTGNTHALKSTRLWRYPSHREYQLVTS